MSILSDIFDVVIGVLDSIAHNFIGLVIFALVVFYLYIKWSKVKPLDMGKEVFNKQWDATAERLRLLCVKTLAICSYPLTVEELRSMAIHQIQHLPIGNVVGINVFGIITKVETLIKLSKDLTEDNFNKLIEENAGAIKDDKFWLVFAIERITGGLPFFRSKKKSLLFLKPAQIININSSDNIIRVRGFGLTPLGEYEIINDENISITRPQLLADTIQNINEELVLGGWAKMGTIVTNAMQSDAVYRKGIAEKSVEVLSSPGRDSKPE